jgi:hypothetical protein
MRQVQFDEIEEASPVTNCEGERSFSTLSRVKNHLMSTMGQTRLSSLSLLCIESGLIAKTYLSRTDAFMSLE